jgi:hypothetical protein
LRDSLAQTLLITQRLFANKAVDVSLQNLQAENTVSGAFNSETLTIIDLTIFRLLRFDK